MGGKAIGRGIGAIAVVVMLTACGTAHHDAAGVHPASQTSTGISPKQLCLTIFKKIAGAKLPSGLHAQFAAALKEAKEIQNLAGQTSSPEIARDLTNLAKASVNYDRAFYNNVNPVVDQTVALGKATETIINALGCTKTGN
jgi:hypothetical protein